jgi:hypothetical protein
VRSLLLVLLSLPASAAAPLVKKCSDADSKAASVLVKSLGAAIERGELAATQSAWKEVSGHRCFRLAMLENARHPEFGDVEAARWWWNRGGDDWLRAALDRNRTDASLPPDWPPVLKREGHALARLICKPEDAACGKETAGWELRAAEALDEPTRDDDRGERPEVLAQRCNTAAKPAKDAAARYQAWRSCVEDARPKAAMLPVGRYEVPRDGWFVLRGRRGHYQFCDEVRMYDLATGAAYVTQSCSGLFLQTGGSVNHEATDDARKAKRLVGRVPIDALREAAWMAMFANEVKEGVQVYAWSAQLPADMTQVWLDDDMFHAGGLGLSGWFSSAQTQLAWSWQGSDGLRASGSLTWPNSHLRGQMHAVRLLRIAEAALVEGCPPAPAPKQLVVGGKPGVSSLDASPESLDRAEARLIEALAQPVGGCR